MSLLTIVRDSPHICSCRVYFCHQPTELPPEYQVVRLWIDIKSCAVRIIQKMLLKSCYIVGIAYRDVDMTPEKLDFIFPFVVLAYGATMTFVLNSRTLVELAENRLPAEITQQIKGHRVLALICLSVGAFWSLQNLWL